MNIQFKKDDSLYKIFKILKKIPPYRKASISINSNHELFEHKWWAHQIADLIEKQHIQATFLVQNKEQAQFFQNVGLPVEYKNKQGLAGIRERIKNFIFSSGSIHQQLLAQKNTQSYLILAAEVAVLILVGIFFRGLVSPKATIIVTPSNEIIPIVYQYELYPIGSEPSSDSEMHGQIAIPYHEGTVEYNKELTVDVQDVTYTYEQASGRVRFENTLDEQISLIGGTQLETEDGILFTIDQWVNVPPGSEEDPGTVSVPATARETTEDGIGIGEQSNIEAGTKLYIKNLEESTEDEAIIAYAQKDFSGGETTGKGTVLQNDIDRIEEKILASMKLNKRRHLQEQFFEHDSLLLLPYDDLIELEVDEFVSTATVGESATFVNGTMKGSLSYYYITIEEFYTAVDEYLEKRPVEGKFLIDYDPHSISFYEYRTKENKPEYFDIPIGINAIWGYNFNDDTFNLGEEMINEVKNQSRDEARRTILSYDEVRKVDIDLSPPRYDTLPQDPERISIKHTLNE